jgi:hypothetical protein
LPFLLAVTFVIVTVLLRGPWTRHRGLRAGGFGCSALLRLTISFGQEQLVAMGLRWRAV